jgi:hypothetical protein
MAKNKHIVGGDGLCTCGCGAPTAPKRLFRQGHDAKLKGALIQAYRAGDTVVAIHDGERTEFDPMTLAARFGWEHFLTAVPGQAKAKGPKVGQSVKIKVGRWTYDAVVGGTVEGGTVYSYLDKKGNTKEALNPQVVG